MKMWHPNLNYLMKKHKMHQHELARHLNVTRGSVGHYVCGRRQPPLETMKMMAYLFNVGVDEFIFEDLQAQKKERVYRKDKVVLKKMKILEDLQEIDKKLHEIMDDLRN